MPTRYKKILLVDDDENLTKVIFFQLSSMGFDVTTAVDGESGFELFKQNSFDILITDLQLPGLSGMELLTSVRRLDKNIIILLITAYGTVENAIEASRLGADDYITKPFGKEMLRFIIEKAIRMRELQTENIQLRGELYQKYEFGNVIAKSAAMDDVLKLTGQVAESDATVLIQGESGTGKELIARAIHYNSNRHDKPLITVNCPSIPENLIESELFGHVRGAFTGAVKDRRGKFQLADRGTIFLDEIGDLKDELQARLLRVLQEKEFERVGDSAPIKVDVRVVAATNKNLETLVAQGKFREDLYYRLNVVTIAIPPLRERKDDIPFLIDYFMKKHGKDKKFGISDDALDLIMQYDWPGNVRELENTIERAIIISTEPVIKLEVLQPISRNLKKEFALPPEIGADENLTFEEIEKRAILNALSKTKGNKTKAAKLLDVPRHVLLYRMKKLGI